jgi:hypothetical protein
LGRAEETEGGVIGVEESKSEEKKRAILGGKGRNESRVKRKGEERGKREGKDSSEERRGQGEKL